MFYGVVSTQNITIIPDNHILKILRICEPQVSRSSYVIVK